MYTKRFDKNAHAHAGLLRRNFCQPAKKQAKPDNERGVRGALPRKILDFYLLKMRFLGIFEQFLIKKKSIFLLFFEMFSCISLLKDLILTISFNRKKPSGHNEKVDLSHLKF